MSIQLTAKQIEYLLLFATWHGYGYSISEAANRFGVRLPTASRMVDILYENGCLIKESSGLIQLTDEGMEIIRPLLKPLNRLTIWLESDVGLPPCQAEQEARRMIVSLEPDSITAMLRYVNAGKTPLRKKSAERKIKLSPGSYSVDFKVLKKGTQNKSMGDSGFAHPAQLLCTESGTCLFQLVSRPIIHPVGKGEKKQTQGVLDRLWYWNENAWVECVHNDYGVYQLPVFALSGNGKIRIRLRTSVGLLVMPESEADIVFDIKQLKEIKRMAKMEDVV